VPNVQNTGFVHGIGHLDDLGTRLLVTTIFGTLAYLFTNSTKQLLRASGRRIGALGAGGELHRQSSGQDDSDAGVHDVKTYPFRDSELSLLRAVDLDSGRCEHLLNVLDRQRFLQPTHRKRALWVGEGTTLDAGGANQRLVVLGMDKAAPSVASEVW